MNKDRRKELTAIGAAILEAKDHLEAVRDAEQEAFDNLPDSLQQGERGQAMEEAIGNLESTIANLEDAAGEIEGIANV